VGLFALSVGSGTLSPVFSALQSPAFTLGGRALALICMSISFVCHVLAVVCDSVPLVSDPISLVCEPLASCKLGLASRKGLVVPIKLGHPALELTTLFGGWLDDVGGGCGSGRGVGGDLGAVAATARSIRR
jgi:hypothetical protein